LGTIASYFGGMFSTCLLGGICFLLGKIEGFFLDFYAFMFKDFRGFVGLGCVGRFCGDSSKHLMFVAGGPLPFFAAAKKNLVSWK
jgi:hypothetical protein